jgi:cob(I)alamin adenosyltransferase
MNSALGLARATATEKFVGENLFWIQKSLVDVMGEVGLLTEDLPRYVRDGFKLVTPELTAKLDALIIEIESQKVSFKGWATPGATAHSATLDLARSVCRRAERRVFDLQSAGELKNAEILIFLNRLSDLLWLFARWVETQVDTAGK